MHADYPVVPSDVRIKIAHLTGIPPTASTRQRDEMYKHEPECPPAEAFDREVARAVVVRPEHGWSLLCNGVLPFDSTGELLPDGRIIALRRWSRDRIGA